MKILVLRLTFLFLLHISVRNLFVLYYILIEFIVANPTRLILIQCDCKKLFKEPQNFEAFDLEIFLFLKNFVIFKQIAFTPMQFNLFASFIKSYQFISLLLCCFGSKNPFQTFQAHKISTTLQLHRFCLCFTHKFIPTALFHYSHCFIALKSFPGNVL